jgi:TatD DNase family protein
VIDTHAHLDALDDPAAAVRRAREAGVGRIVTVGTGPESWAETLRIAAEEEGVHAALGLHPHEAANGEALAGLRPLAEGAVAVGEIGLDFFREYAPREDQRRVFTHQLRLAAELRKPAIVHSRASEEETVALLEEFHGTVVLHCFSSPALLPVALDRGYYVSFAGNVTYPRAVDLREAAARVPRDRILAETDCPYLAPQPVRGKTNEPAFVVHTVAALAELRGEDVGELEQQIEANASRALDLQ